MKALGLIGFGDCTSRVRVYRVYSLKGSGLRIPGFIGFRILRFVMFRIQEFCV